MTAPIIYVVEGFEEDFIATALSGAFRSAVCLSAEKMSFVGLLKTLLDQNVAVVLKVKEERLEALKKELPGYVVVPKETNKIDERDNIVERALQDLIQKKLLRPL